METSANTSGRRGVHYAVAAAVLLLIAGLVIVGIGFRGSAAPTAEQPTTVTSQLPRPAGDRGAKEGTQSRADAGQPDFGKVLADSAPTGLSIPAISVRATGFVELGLAANGEIEVPQDPDLPGWFTPGPSPGQLGPAVIAGHVDSTTGPAVFYRLSELRAGDRVSVDRRDGTVAVFGVDRVVSFEKATFPTRAVYGPTRRAELRLITCGGQYDDESGYLSNTVVFAHLLKVPAPIQFGQKP